MDECQNTTCDARNYACVRFTGNGGWRQGVSERSEGRSGGTSCVISARNSSCAVYLSRAVIVCAAPYMCDIVTTALIKPAVRVVRLATVARLLTDTFCFVSITESVVYMGSCGTKRAFMSEVSTGHRVLFPRLAYKCDLQPLLAPGPTPETKASALQMPETRPSTSTR